MAGVSVRTIAYFEAGEGRTSAETKAALRSALEQAGVALIHGKEPGVKLKARR
jgi:hypothetical protein